MVKKLIDFLLFSNLLVSICSALLVSVTKTLLAAKTGLYLEVFTFCSTLAVYNFQRIFPFLFGEIHNPINSKHQWISQNLSPLILISSLALLVAAIIFLFKIQEKLFLVLILIPLFIISFWYAVDLKRIFKTAKTKIKKLRMVPYLKIFLIGFTWGIVTVILPAIEARTSLASVDVWWLFVERVIFVISITLPFDIRDMVQDEHYHVLTIPHKIGAKATVGLSILLLSVFAGLTIARIWVLPNTVTFVWPLLVSAFITAVIVVKAKPEKSEYYFSGLVESTMIIQFVLVYIGGLLQ